MRLSKAWIVASKDFKTFSEEEEHPLYDHLFRTDRLDRPPVPHRGSSNSNTKYRLVLPSEPAGCLLVPVRHRRRPGAPGDRRLQPGRGESPKKPGTPAGHADDRRGNPGRKEHRRLPARYCLHLYRRPDLYRPDGPVHSHTLNHPISPTRTLPSSCSCWPRWPASLASVITSWSLQE